MSRYLLAGVLLAFFVVPVALVHAGLIDWLSERASAGEVKSTEDVRTMPILEGTNNPNPQSTFDGSKLAIVDGTALAADTSPLTGTPVALGSSDQISLYVVREGDTLSQIADMFGVTGNTIRWANDLGPKEAIQEGDQLIILPITGVKYVTKKGDTLKSIAKTYKGDVDEIAQFNGLENGAALTVGLEIIIPHGEVAAPAASKAKPASGGKASAGSNPTYAGYFMRPIKGGVRTQGIHGSNAVDLASSFGSTIYAAAAGEVIISKGDGWNGGYGSYVVIKHDNGTQTLYAHLSANNVVVGQQVAQGEVIGAMGASGKATGTHLHFEIRGATNPF